MSGPARGAGSRVRQHPAVGTPSPVAWWTVTLGMLPRWLGRTFGPVLAAVLVIGTPSAAAEPWTINGSGWGHGVGMSQYGAWQMAVDGYPAPQSLGHYYPGTTYDLVTDNQVVSVNLLNNVASTTLVTSALSTGGGAVTVSNG